MKEKDNNIWRKLKGSDQCFSVPDGYFDSLDERLNDVGPDTTGNAGTKEIKKPGLRNDQSLLNQKKFGTGFKIPQDYFESFEPKALENKRGKVVSIKNKTLRIISLAIAASVLLFFGINNINSKFNTADEPEFQDEEFASWIESDLVDLNSYEIAEAFSDVDLDHSVYNEEGIDEYLNTLDIENLILDNN